MKTDIYKLSIMYGALHTQTADATPPNILGAGELIYRYKSIKLAVDSVKSFLSLLSEENPYTPIIDTSSVKLYYNQIYRSFRANNEKYVKYFYFLNSVSEDKSYKLVIKVTITPEKILTKASSKDELQNDFHKRLKGNSKELMLNLLNSIQDARWK